MSLRGDLAELGIGELLQTITLNNHEGTLKIHSEKEGDRYFYLSKGEIQLVSPGKKGLRLGEALVKANKVTQDDLTKALSYQAGTHHMLGKTLVELGLVQESDVEGVVHQQFREEFFEIFLLTKGDFDFYFRTKPDQIVQFDETVSRVSVNTSSLMLEALRQIDEWQVMSKSIATPRAIFKVDTDSLEGTVDELAPADDVRKAVDLIDGKRTIAEIVEKTPATKFDVYALLYRLIEKRAIRSLTHQECADNALGAEVGGDTYAATLFYDYGTFLDPDDLDMRERQFKLLKRLAVYKEAKDAAIAIADAKLEAKDHEAALQYYLEAQACDDKDLHAAEGAFRCSLLIGTNSVRSAKFGDEYVRLALRQHEVKKARDALGALVDLEPDVHRRRIQLADLQDDDREGRAKAVQLLDEAVQGLVKPEDATLRADAARKLMALDARRTDLQQTVREAVLSQEELNKQRVQKLVIANVGGLLILLVVYAIFYELNARKAFAEAEQVAGESGADVLALASELFRDITVKYPWSTVSSRADSEMTTIKARLGGLAAEERKKREAEEARRRANSEEARRQTAIEKLRHAEALEKRGAYREAAEEKLEVLREYADVKLDQRVRVPIPIATEPPGAHVRRGTEDLGVTPMVVYVEPLRDAKVKLELPGYAPVELTFKVDRSEEANVTLDRTALWSFATAGAISAAPATFGGRVFVASRDGEVYALDAASGALAWHYRLGEYGDVLSAPGVAGGKVVVGNIEGAVHAFDPANATIAWSYESDGGAVRAEVRTSPDEMIAAIGSATGVAHFFKTANAAPLFTVKTDSRVDAPIAFGPGRAYVASRDGRIYAVDTANGNVVWKFAASDDFLAAPLVLDDAVVAGSRDGSVYALEAASGKVRWRVATAGRIRGAPVRAGAIVAVPSEDGTLYGIDARSGSGLWRFAAKSPLVSTPVVAPKGIYVVSTGGMLYRVDPGTGTSEWKFPVGASVSASPAVAEGRIYLGATDGVIKAILE